MNSHINWCRHSLCSIEGDILLANIEVALSNSSDYLIPSLMVLKRKVDRVFGSQKVVSLSENRPHVNESTWSDEAGKAQFQLYAETVLKQNKVITSEFSSLSPLKVTPSEPSSLDCVAHNIGLSLQEHSEKGCPSLEPSEIHSSLLSYTSPYEKAGELSGCDHTSPYEKAGEPNGCDHPSPYENPEEPNGCDHTSLSIKYIHQYTYCVAPPSRSLKTLSKQMTTNHISLFHYNAVGNQKEFNTLQFLQHLPQFANSPLDTNGNRIQFWSELLKDEVDPAYSLRSLFSVEMNWCSRRTHINSNHLPSRFIRNRIDRWN